MATEKQVKVSTNLRLQPKAPVCGPGKMKLGFTHSKLSKRTSNKLSNEQQTPTVAINKLQIRQLIGVLGNEESSVLPRMICGKTGGSRARHTAMTSDLSLLRTTTIALRTASAYRQDIPDSLEGCSTHAPPLETVLKRQNRPRKYNNLKYKSTLKSFKRTMEREKQTKAKPQSREKRESAEREWIEGMSEFSRSQQVSPIKSEPSARGTRNGKQSFRSLTSLSKNSSVLPRIHIT